MTEEILQGYSIPDFFRAHEDLDWKEDTIHRYNKYLHELLDFLDGQEPYPEILEDWKSRIEARYSRSGVNGYLAAANNYFLWCGRPEPYLRRTPGENKDEEPQSPAMTRTEYLKLLRTARGQGRRRSYLLIKIFALTGIPLQCLDQDTVELVRQGQGVLSVQNRKENEFLFCCPEGLREEFLAYAIGNGIYHGPVFASSRGNLLGRTVICRDMKEVCHAAGISTEKGNPGSLRRLYQETQQDLDEQLERLRQRMYDQMLELEQDMIGWTPEQEDAPRSGIPRMR